MISLWPTCNLACIPDGSTKTQKVFCFTHPKGTLAVIWAGSLGRLEHKKVRKLLDSSIFMQYSAAGGRKSQHDWTIKAFIAGNHARKPNNLSLSTAFLTITPYIIYIATLHGLDEYALVFGQWWHPMVYYFWIANCCYGYSSGHWLWRTTSSHVNLPKQVWWIEHQLTGDTLLKPLLGFWYFIWKPCERFFCYF